MTTQPQSQPTSQFNPSSQHDQTQAQRLARIMLSPHRQSIVNLLDNQFLDKYARAALLILLEGLAFDDHDKLATYFNQLKGK